MKRPFQRITAQVLVSAMLLSAGPTVLAEQTQTVPSTIPENRLITDEATGRSFISIQYTNPLYSKANGDLENLTEAEKERIRQIEEAGAILKQGLLNREAQIVVPFPAVAEYEDALFYDILKSAFTHDGTPNGGDYLAGHCTDINCEIEWADNEMQFLFIPNYNSTLEQETEVDEAVPEILKSLKLKGKDDYGKLKAIHDYLAKKCTLVEKSDKEEDVTSKYTAYGALIEGKAFSQGFTLAFYRLCLEAGIDNRVVYGTVGKKTAKETQSWNLVEVEDLYYHADVALDDAKTRKYFLKGSETFAADHFMDAAFLEESFTADYPISKTDYNHHPITITANPVDAVYNAYAFTAFTVSAAGTNIRYQWQVSKDGGYNWVDCTESSAVNSTFTFRADPYMNGFRYRCVMKTDSDTAISGTALLNVRPGILKQPVSETAAPGDTVHFIVKAAAAIQWYQWQYSSDGGYTWQNCTGTTANTNDYSFVMDPLYHGLMYRCVVTNPYGTVYSNYVTVSLKIVPLEITQQPEGVVAKDGQSVTFKVTAKGTGDLAYRWQVSHDTGATWENCTETGCNTAQLSLTMASILDGNLYRCIINDSLDSTISNAVELKAAILGPKITAQPVNASAKEGETVTLSVSATGEGSLSYEWQVSTDGGSTWAEDASGTDAVFSFPMRLELSGYLYRCVISDFDGTVTSDIAKLTLVETAPEITSDPVSASVTEGDTVTFSVAATASGKLNYQWQVSTDGSTWTDCAGATAASYSFTAALSANGNHFRCQVSTLAGTNYSYPAVLTVKAAIAPPTVTAQPAGVTVTEGETATFTVAASAEGTLTYQWQTSTDGGSSWSDCGSSASYSFNASLSANGSLFRCIITNEAGSVTSNSASLTVNAAMTPPVIVSNPSSASAAEGDPVTMSVSADGDGTISYRWQVSTDGGSSWSDCGSSASYSFTMSAELNGAMFHCIVSNEVGSSVSSAASVTLA